MNENENKIYFTFNVREKGYGSIIDKNRIKYFNKLNYDGFIFIYSSKYNLQYAITEKLLRQIKILKLNNQLKNGNVYKNISEIIELSKKTTHEDQMCSWQGSSMSYNRWCNFYEIEELDDKKNHIKYQNRYFNKLKK